MFTAGLPRRSSRGNSQCPPAREQVNTLREIQIQTEGNEDTEVFTQQPKATSQTCTHVLRRPRDILRDTTGEAASLNGF